MYTFGGHTWAVNSVAFSPDGKRVLTGSDDGTARIWQLLQPVPPEPTPPEPPRMLK
ncbi:MAG: WD40 repeat domain-containing protein [Candidatus Bipolaricaulota bacterium]